MVKLIIDRLPVKWQYLECNKEYIMRMSKYNTFYLLSITLHHRTNSDQPYIKHTNVFDIEYIVDTNLFGPSCSASNN